MMAHERSEIPRDNFGKYKQNINKNKINKFSKIQKKI